MSTRISQALSLLIVLSTFTAPIHAQSVFRDTAPLAWQAVAERLNGPDTPVARGYNLGNPVFVLLGDDVRRSDLTAISRSHHGWAVRDLDDVVPVRCIQEKRLCAPNAPFDTLVEFGNLSFEGTLSWIDVATTGQFEHKGEPFPYYIGWRVFFDKTESGAWEVSRVVITRRS